MPRVLARESSNGTPIAALVTTNLSVQAFLLAGARRRRRPRLHAEARHRPHPGALPVGGRRTPPSWRVTRETYAADEDPERRKQLLVAVLAIVYSGYLLYAAGPEFLLLGCLIYAPGTVLYVLARREHRARVFRPAEAVACALLCALAVLAVVLLARGAFDLL